DNKYQWRQIPADHPIYTDEQFAMKRKLPAIAISNGARELLVLLAADPSKAWQMHAYKGNEDNWQFMANLFLYSVAQTNLENKGKTYIVKTDDNMADTRTMKIARLQYDGNWDPEPGGWRQFAAVMHNSARTILTVETVKLGDGKLAGGGYAAAHLTGTAALK